MKDVSSRDYFRLWDDDGATGDDVLGSTSISSTPEIQALTLKGNGSIYQLNFRKL
jgi:hypothetical protein